MTVQFVEVEFLVVIEITGKIPHTICCVFEFFGTHCQLDFPFTAWGNAHLKDSTIRTKSQTSRCELHQPRSTIWSDRPAEETLDGYQGQDTLNVSEWTGGQP